MSVLVSGLVWERSEHKGSDLLVLLAIADNAKDDGRAWPGVAHLARKTRLRPRAIKYAIGRLLEGDELLRVQRGGGEDSSLYCIELDVLRGKPERLGDPVQSLHRAKVAPVHRDAREPSEAQASSSENPPTSPKGTAGGSPPPQPSPLRARSRARGAGPDQDRAALDRLAEPLRPFVVPVRQVLLRIAEARTGSYEPTVAAICAALAAHPRKDFLPEASKYEHWALHGAGRDQRVKDVVRQFRNWIDRAPDVLRRTPPMSAGGGDDATSRLREHLRPRLLEEGGFKNAEIDAMSDTALRVAEAEL